MIKQLHLYISVADVITPLQAEYMHSTPPHHVCMQTTDTIERQRHHSTDARSQASLLCCKHL